MSDTEAEPFQMDLLLQPVRANLPTAQVAPSSSRGRSRKRTAEIEASEVPSASRRRRLATAADYLQANYPQACCIDGIAQPGPCLNLQSGSGRSYQSVNGTPILGASTLPLPPVYRPQFVGPQMRTQLAPMPSTSSVNNAGAPVSYHIHNPQGIPFTYAPSVQISQNRDTVYHIVNNMNNPPPGQMQTGIDRSPGRLTQSTMSQRQPLTSIIYPPNIGEPERMNSVPMASEPVMPSAEGTADATYARPLREWPTFQTPGPFGWSTMSVPVPSARFEMLLSRVRQAAAQAAATAAAQAVDTTAIFIAAQAAQARERTYSPRVLESLDLSSPSVAASLGDLSEQPGREYASDFHILRHVEPVMFNEDSPQLEPHFRNWEATLLQVFDRMAPHMSLIRMQPKGMPKNEIDQLRSFRLTSPKLLKEKVCVICQCDFEKKEHIRVLPCEHHFHVKCVDKWLKTNRTCPICRKSASEPLEIPMTSPPVMTSASSASNVSVYELYRAGLQNISNNGGLPSSTL